ncbi:MAG: DNA translocase FtsK 4TM domain-containing protein [Bacteroidales bacterium]
MHELLLFLQTDEINCMAGKVAKNKEEGKTGKGDGVGKKSQNPNQPWWQNDEKTRAVVGFFLFAAGIYLLLAQVSFLLNWQADFDKITGLTFRDIVEGKSLFKNASGLLGAAIAYYLIYKGFGISTLVIPILLIASGLRIALAIRLFSLKKAVRLSFYLLIWLSLTLGLALHAWAGTANLLGGVFGNQIALWLSAVVGAPGLAIILAFILIAFTSIHFHFPQKWIQRRREQRKLKQELEAQAEAARKAAASSPASGVFNLEEYAVDETDEENPQAHATAAHQKQEIHADFPDSSQTTPTPKGQEPELIVIRKNTTSPTETNTNTPAKEVELEVVSPEADKPDDNDVLTHEVGDPLLSRHNLQPFDPTADLPDFRFPTLDLLENYSNSNANVYQEELDSNKKRIVETLNNYQIEIQHIKATIGPTVTLYEIVPAPGIRISKIKNLEDDIALSLAALGIRIIAPIPGKGTIGIEVPNQNPEIVSMRSLLSSEKFQNTRYDLPIALGKTISNETYIADLTRMPHLLMAGATGQGKSVGLNAIITSLLYKKHPSQLKIVLVDPKKVELSLYNKIERHYLAKLPDAEEAIITDMRQVVRTLNSLVIEMEQRYALLKMAQVRLIKEYNAKYLGRRLNPEEGHRFLPYIVLIIDEFADLIMTAGKEIEYPITRLAQMSRAVGIHLIIATQRPSVNIITGTIKANFPARMAFRVSSKIDSRTILDTGGAEQLIGRGDMLLSIGSDLLRLQCAFVDLPEIERVTDFIGSQRGYPDAFHLPEYYEGDEEAPEPTYDPSERDPLFEEAARLVVIHQQGSTSLIQRKLKLGYNRAGRIMDQLEAAGIVGPNQGSKVREVRVATEMALEQFLKDLYSKD